MLCRKTQKALWNCFKDVITWLRAQDLSVPRPRLPRPVPHQAKAWGRGWRPVYDNNKLNKKRCQALSFTFFFGGMETFKDGNFVLVTKVPV